MTTKALAVPNLKPAVEKAIKEAAADWREEYLSNDMRAVKNHVRDVLDRQLTNIVAGFLGFSNRWHQWEVDHCNGRTGDSYVGQEVREIATAKAEEVVKEALRDWEPTKAIKDAILREFKEHVERRGREIARDLAFEYAQSQVEEIVREGLAISRDEVEDDGTEVDDLD